MNTASATSPQPASSRVMLVVLLASNLLASLDQSMMNVALDTVAGAFRIELALANWMVLGFAIVAGATITTAASVLARVGLRRVMVAGYALSLAGGLLGFFSWDFPSMLAARLLQAVTAGLFFPVVSAAILAIAPKGKSATLLSLNSAVIGAGLAFAPLLSGMLITYVSLRAAFLLPAVLAAVLLTVGSRTIHDIEPRAFRKIDLLSILLSFAGLTLFIYGVNVLGKDLLSALALMAAGGAVLAAFALWQLRLKEPLLDLRPLRHATFTIGELIALLGFMGSLYMSLLVPLYLEGTAGCTPFVAGCYLVTPIFAYVAATYLGGRIEDARGIWPLVPAGFALLVAGLIVTGLAASRLMTIGVLVGAGAAYAGVGLAYAPLKSYDLEAVPARLISNASAIHSTFSQVVTSFASALFVGVMSSDATRLLAGGASKADAYAAGFSHTLLIELGIAATLLVAAIVFSLVARRRRSARQNVQKDSAGAAR